MPKGINSCNERIRDVFLPCEGYWKDILQKDA
jgi:hypothetical protein